MDSHIQTPKFLLKQFSTKTSHINEKKLPEVNNCVFCLNLATKKITKENIETINTYKDYYSKEVEMQLCNIEMQFSKLINELKKTLKSAKYNKNKMIFDLQQYEVIIKKFFEYSLIRGKRLMSQVRKKSIFADIFPITPSDIVSNFKKIDLSDVSNNYTPAIIVSEGHNFVLPKCCWYSTFVENSNIAILPISPNIAICLVDNNFYQKILLESGEIRILTCDNDQIIEANKYAFAAEFNADREFIFAKNEKELLDLVEYIDLM